MSQTIEQLMSGLHPLERIVLSTLNARHPTRAMREEELAAEPGLDASRLSMALGWLVKKDALSIDEQKQPDTYELTPEGRRYAEKMPEDRIFDLLKAGPVTVQDVRAQSGLEALEVSKAIGNLKQADCVRVGDGGQLQKLTDELPPDMHVLQGILQQILGHGGSRQERTDWLTPERREFMTERLGKSWKVSPDLWRQHAGKDRTVTLTSLGQALAARLPADADVGEAWNQLTPEMLKDGSWKSRPHRKYSIDLNPPRISAGRKHPYRQYLDTVGATLASMGFEEMRGPMVESEFWNMDALFMPQFHPARDIHDVYFIKELPPAGDIEPALLERVAVTHERGGTTGSAGWRYPFDRLRAAQPILRSQGTAVSARTLAHQPRIPGKYFSIARCFRYDQVDATHAPDFFQIEGIVLDPSATFRTLLGLLRLFATKLAKADDVKFLPAYFPFTEPSVEMHVRHPRLGWIELGGAGLFRPEVTAPMGVDAPVIAWGLGLDRMAMVAMGLHDIRELFTSNLDVVRQLPPPGRS